MVDTDHPRPTLFDRTSLHLPDLQPLNSRKAKSGNGVHPRTVSYPPYGTGRRARLGDTDWGEFRFRSTYPSPPAPGHTDSRPGALGVSRSTEQLPSRRGEVDLERDDQLRVARQFPLQPRPLSKVRRRSGTSRVTVPYRRLVDAASVGGHAIQRHSRTASRPTASGIGAFPSGGLETRTEHEPASSPHTYLALTSAPGPG
jgi:hypothetical protein